MRKKVFVFGGLFVALVGLSVFLLLRTQPRIKEGRPLEQADPTKISKIIIDEPARSVTLERKEHEWRLKAPLEDAVEPEGMDQLIGTLTSFTVGSILSEKKEKYPTFDLNEGKAIHVRVYEGEKTQPILDAFVGKQAISYGTSYFRFAEKPPVYIAGSLPNWIFIKPPEEYRLHKVLSTSKDSVTKVELSARDLSRTFSKSSATWTGSNGSTVDPKVANDLLDRILAWKAVGFLDQPDPNTKPGLDKPTLLVNIQTSSGTFKVVIGDKIKPKKGEPDPNRRTAQTEGRNTILLLENTVVDEFLKFAKTLPK